VAADPANANLFPNLYQRPVPSCGWISPR